MQCAHNISSLPLSSRIKPPPNRCRDFVKVHGGILPRPQLLWIGTFQKKEQKSQHAGPTHTISLQVVVFDFV